jgi:hypothetical protein
VPADDASGADQHGDNASTKPNRAEREWDDGSLFADA